MKLKKLEKIRKNKKKVLLGTFVVLCSLGIGLLLGRTFSLYQVNKSFEFVNGKVNYYGKSDVYFAFYNGDTWLEEMPKKGNSENLEFEKAECDNNTTVEWNEERWAPLVLNLNKTKTRCTLYFKKATSVQFPGKRIPLAEEETDGLYIVGHNNLSEISSEWSKTEYRYAGVNPNNYVSFNNELWRIIGLVNVQTNNGVEQRVKIIRTNGISGQKDFGNYVWDRNSSYTNNWTTSKLKEMLNGIYYNSLSGVCYTASNGSAASQSTCDFSGSSATYPKGLDDTAKNMIDSEVIWNIGGSSSYDATVGNFYEKERGTSTYSTYPAEWTTANDTTNHKGIGLMYPSDYGYATHGGSTGRASCFAKELYSWNGSNYKTDCANNDWLKPSSGLIWTLSPDSSDSDFAFGVRSGGPVSDGVFFAGGVWPVGYLSSSTAIYGGDGSINNPFKLKSAS